MTAAQFARHIINFCESIHEFQVFMFGSSLNGHGSDFDILVVGPSGESLSRLKAEIALAAQELPIDILCMLPAEAKETDFIAREGCVPLAQVAIFKNNRHDGDPKLQ